MYQFKPKTTNRLNRMLSAPDKLRTRTPGGNGMLSRLFRTILQDLNITGQRFAKFMEDYITDTRNGVPNNKKDQTSMRGNLNKEFSREQMTWKVFCKALRFLQFTRVEIILRCHHANGTITEHKDALDLGQRFQLAEFEERLEQPPEHEALGEEVPVLDHFREMEEAQRLHQAKLPHAGPIPPAPQPSSTEEVSE